MGVELWITVAIVAAGTFAMRSLPYVWMKRRLTRQQHRDAKEALPAWLIVLGPAMISAMFGVSLVPSSTTLEAWLATASGIALTLGVWYKTKSLSWPVFAGVVMYALILFVAT